MVMVESTVQLRQVLNNVQGRRVVERLDETSREGSMESLKRATQREICLAVDTKNYNELTTFSYKTVAASGTERKWAHWGYSMLLRVRY